MILIHIPDTHEKDYLLDDINKFCRINYFHTFDYRLFYDINFTNISNNKENIFAITHRSMEFKIELYGLNTTNKNARRKGFIFNQIKKLIIKIFNLSNINIHYYLKQ